MKRNAWIGCGLALALAGTAPASGQPRAGKAEPVRPGLSETSEPRPSAERAPAPGRSLGALPASEVVHLECPRQLVYYAPTLDTTDPKLQGWQVAPVRPVTPRTTLRFVEIPNLRTGNWMAASTIECKYQHYGSGPTDRSYYTTAKRKIHPSGTQYRCKLQETYGPKVECRLSITPDF